MTALVFRTPSRTVLVAIWLVVSGVVAVMLFQGVRSTDQYGVVRYLLHAAYVAALLWFLNESGHDPSRLPEVRQQLLPRREVFAWIPAAIIGLLLVLTMIADDGSDILLLLMMGSTIWLLVVWWRQIRLVPVVQGLALATIAGVAIIPAMRVGFVSETALYLLAGMVATMYVVGGILFRRTELGGVQLLDGRYAGAVRSFLLGCLLFFPIRPDQRGRRFSRR
jgi:surface polysaccharide O-acyltransferase-like enzyme